MRLLPTSARRTALPLLAASAGTARAHEKWFVDASNAPFDLASALTPPALGYVVAALLVVLVAAVLWRARGRRGFLPGPEVFGAVAWRRSALYGLIPAVLGAHLAVPLLAFGVSGALFAPSVQLGGGWPYLLGLMQTGIALSLFYGGFARLAAVALGLVWLLGFAVASPLAMLENAHIPAFAAFFFLAGRGPLAIDRLIFPRLEPSEALMRRAVPVLRVGVGIGLVVVALSEKLAALPLALTFLERYPLNFIPALGLPMSDATFMLSAGAVELAIGLMLVFGVFVREVIVIAWLPFNLTLTVFDWTELIGHLPFYGVMAVLLVWTPGGRDLELWVSGLRGGPLSIDA